MAKPTEHGEIWESDLEKRRPVVIVSRDDVRGRRSETTVAVVTSAIRGLPTEVVIDHRDGVGHLSAINCDDLWTIRKLRLTRRLGRLSKERIASLDRALRFALQLD